MRVRECYDLGDVVQLSRASSMWYNEIVVSLFNGRARILLLLADYRWEFEMEYIFTDLATMLNNRLRGPAYGACIVVLLSGKEL